MPGIALEHVVKSYGDDGSAPAVRGITFTIEEGELVVLLGPSGCGKTTVLRMINRLIEPTSGRISIGGREIHDFSATDLRRHIGYVIQQVGLFPHMTVAQNVATVPKLLGWKKEHIRERSRELLDLVALPPDQYMKRYPRQLSGGQQQRVGIARAMAADPQILLMDEPFGAIDAITRGDLQQELLRIQQKVSKTIVFVTHDVEEALLLADRIAVMRSGELVQYDTPLALLSRPADDFVAGLLGSGDILRHLSLLEVTALMEHNSESPQATRVPAGTNVRDALSVLLGAGADRATVVDGNGEPLGELALESILTRAHAARD
jgi:osmoprotectant transport system ATP-binding protein